MPIEVKKTTQAELDLLLDGVEQVRLKNLILDGVDLSGRNLVAAQIENVHFVNCNLNNVKMQCALLQKVYFRNCKLNDFVFSGASLKKVEFDFCELNGALLADVSARGLVCTNSALCNAVLSGDFAGSDFTKTTLGGADLSGCDFSKSKFKGATLNRCDLTSTIFKQCKMSSAYINDANLDRTNFTNADLIGSCMKNCFKNDVVIKGSRLEFVKGFATKPTRSKFIRDGYPIKTIVEPAQPLIKLDPKLEPKVNAYEWKQRRTSSHIEFYTRIDDTETTLHRFIYSLRAEVLKKKKTKGSPSKNPVCFKNGNCLDLRVENLKCKLPPKAKPKPRRADAKKPGPAEGWKEKAAEAAMTPEQKFMRAEKAALERNKLAKDREQQTKPTDQPKKRKLPTTGKQIRCKSTITEVFRNWKSDRFDSNPIRTNQNRFVSVLIIPAQIENVLVRVDRDLLDQLVQIPWRMDERGIIYGYVNRQRLTLARYVWQLAKPNEAAPKRISIGSEPPYNGTGEHYDIDCRIVNLKGAV